MLSCSARNLDRSVLRVLKSEFRRDSRPGKKNQGIRIVQLAQQLRGRETQPRSAQIEVHRPDGISAARHSHRSPRYVDHACGKLQLDLKILVLRQRKSTLVIVEE